MLLSENVELTYVSPRLASYRVLVWCLYQTNRASRLFQTEVQILYSGTPYDSTRFTVLDVSFISDTNILAEQKKRILLRTFKTVTLPNKNLF